MIGIYGGCFDPVHLGHLGVAKAAYTALQLERVFLVPLGLATHRQQPVASAGQRLHMLNLALDAYPAFEALDIEVAVQRPSYTIHTLQSLKQRYAEKRLCLLMGSDTFLLIDQWYQWQRLLDYAHIVVVQRQGHSCEIKGVVSEYLEHHQCKTEDVIEQPSHASQNPLSGNGIVWINADVPAVSSTEVRAAIANQLSLANLLTETVTQYIIGHQLYA